MCGIVGYIGNQDAKDILLKGLEKLEYRGYDSAGIAVMNRDGVHVFKEKGRIAALKKEVDPSVGACTGIGHTRWATHGAATRVNAHPHTASSRRFTLVHNGVIENYQELKKTHLAGRTMTSETDTEILVQLIDTLTETGLSTKEAFRQMLSLAKGSYAIALLDNQDPDHIYVAKNKSPLLVGIGDGFNVVASDAMAMIQVTDTYLEIVDKEMVTVSKTSIAIEDENGRVVQRQPFTAEIDATDVEKGTYPHYMLKEIDEQPLVMRRIVGQYQDDQGALHVEEDVRLAMKQADRIHIVACGTSYHAGLIGKEFIEKLAGIPTDVHVASEFVYNPPLFSERPLILFISQSGETADSRAALQAMKAKRYPTITLTNVKGSTLSREADHTLLLYAGPEIAVASTKAYTAQIAVLAILAVDTAEAKGITLSFDPLRELAVAAQAMEILTTQKEVFDSMAREFLSTTRNAFFIGRSMDYYVCLEAALKLKEISYIQAEGFAGGELKHGTIALIEEGTPVIALTTQEGTDLNIRGNVQEVVARGAHPCILAMEGMEQEGDTFVIPHVHPMLTALISVVPMQLISYYAALHRQCDVDKPRNLAKSVTVE